MRKLFPLIFPLLAFCASCTSREDEPTQQTAEGHVLLMPHALIVLEDLPQNSLLPPTARSLSPDSSVCFGMLATDFSGSVPDVLDLLIADALESDKLLLLVDCEAETIVSSRENIVITSLTSASHHPAVDPPELASEIEGYDWTDLLQRQHAIISLADKYLPDIIIVRTWPENIETAIRICELWMQQTSSGKLRVTFYSPPGPDAGRGWAVFSGPGIHDGVLIGMTPTDFLATVRVLSGLPWEPSISSGIPGLAAMSVIPLPLCEGLN